VEHRQEADLGAEVPGVGGEGLERLGGGLEKESVDEAPVLEGERGERPGQGEDDVEVLDGEEVSQVPFEPPGLLQGLAKLWRSTWSVTRLVRPAARAIWRQAYRTEDSWRGCSPVWPGKSQGRGR
jgi:hypothetical protein